MRAAVSVAAVLVEKSVERWSERALRMELGADRERKTYKTATKGGKVEVWKGKWLELWDCTRMHG
jgi:hypothetical protein